MELYLVRHGLSVANRKDIIQGQTEYPLDPEGVRQAELLAPRLAKAGFNHVYASDLGRALATARILAPGTEITALPALREWDLGDWTGRIGAEVRDGAPEAWRAFRDPATLDYRVPGGESRRELRDRVVEALHGIARAHPEGRVLAVSHAGALGSAFSGIFGCTARVSCDNASLSIFRHEAGQWTLVRWNDVAHLESSGGGGTDEPRF